MFKFRRSKQRHSDADIIGKWGRTPDPFYTQVFNESLALEGLPEGGRAIRFWQFIQLFKATQHLPGEIAEAGCLYGLSALLMSAYEKQRDPNWQGETLHLFDSFRGFDKYHPHDLGANGSKNKYIKDLSTEEAFQDAPSFLHQTQKNLAKYPKINFWEGWIPEVFENQPKRQYRFVHLDLDLYEPTYASLSYFYPLLAVGGYIVLDDFGFVDWPGVSKATTDFCSQHNCSVVPLFTGNAYIHKIA